MQPAPLKQKPLVWPYVVGMAFYVYVFAQILGFDQSDITNPIVGGMYFILFGVHETAHLVLSFLPPVVTAASGSLSEIAFGALVVFVTLRTNAYFALPFALLWLMLALMSAGRYMADAVPQSMPLIGPGENPQHDWHFVFSQTGLLEQSAAIGEVVRICGYAVGGIALFVGVLIAIAKMAKRYG